MHLIVIKCITCNLADTKRTYLPLLAIWGANWARRSVPETIGRWRRRREWGRDKVHDKENWCIDAQMKPTSATEPWWIALPAEVAAIRHRAPVSVTGPVTSRKRVHQVSPCRASKWHFAETRAKPMQDHSYCNDDNWQSKRPQIIIRKLQSPNNGAQWGKIGSDAEQSDHKWPVSMQNRWVASSHWVKQLAAYQMTNFVVSSGPHLEGSLKAKTGKDHVLYSEPLAAFSDHFIDPFDG